MKAYAQSEIVLRKRASGISIDLFEFSVSHLAHVCIHRTHWKNTCIAGRDSRMHEIHFTVECVYANDVEKVNWMLTKCKLYRTNVLFADIIISLFIFSTNNRVVKQFGLCGWYNYNNFNTVFYTAHICIIGAGAVAAVAVVVVVVGCVVCARCLVVHFLLFLRKKLHVFE